MRIGFRTRCCSTRIKNIREHDSALLETYGRVATNIPPMG